MEGGLAEPEKCKKLWKEQKQLLTGIGLLMEGLRFYLLRSGALAFCGKGFNHQGLQHLLIHIRQLPDV